MERGDSWISYLHDYLLWRFFNNLFSVTIQQFVEWSRVIFLSSLRMHYASTALRNNLVEGSV